MMAPAATMTLPGELGNCFFPHSALTTLPWIQHYPPVTTPLKTYSTPQSLPPTRVIPTHPISTTNSIGHNQQPSTQTHPPSRKKSSRKSNKSNYKHVPHKDKPPHLVARRNARERRRVQAVNSAFARLRKSVPIENRSKRLSKVKTLHRAIEYINGLQNLLRGGSGDGLTPPPALHSSTEQDDDDEENDADEEDFHVLDDYLESDDAVEFVNKENTDRKSWLSIRGGCDSYEPYISCYDSYSGSLAS